MVDETTKVNSEKKKPAPKKRGRPRKVDNKDAVVKPKVVTADDKGEYIFGVGKRKRAVARIFLYRSGKGEIEVNGKEYKEYFGSSILEDIANGSLAISPFAGKIKVVAKVRGGGKAGQAVAVRLGIARILEKLDETLRPIYRAKGYLTRDPREKERKKYGLKKARKAPQFSKR